MPSTITDVNPWATDIFTNKGDYFITCLSLGSRPYLHSDLCYHTGNASGGLESGVLHDQQNSTFISWQWVPMAHGGPTIFKKLPVGQHPKMGESRCNTQLLVKRPVCRHEPRPTRINTIPSWFLGEFILGERDFVKQRFRSLAMGTLDPARCFGLTLSSFRHSKEWTKITLLVCSHCSPTIRTHLRERLACPFGARAGGQMHPEMAMPLVNMQPSLGRRFHQLKQQQ